MNKQAFFDAMKPTAELDGAHFRQLRELVNEYPYFQSAYLLLARTAVDMPNTNVNNVMAKVATHVGNRERLYTFLNPGEVLVEEEIEPHRTITTVQDQINEQIEEDETDKSINDLYADKQLGEEEGKQKLGDETVILDKQTVYSKLLNKKEEQQNNIVAPSTKTNKEKPIVIAEEETENNEWVQEALNRKLSPAVENDPTNDTEEVPMDTDHIQEVARKQVEEELKKQMQVGLTETPLNEAKKETPAIEEEVQEIIKKDVERDLEALKEESKGVEEAVNNFDFNDKSLEADDDFLKELQAKVDKYRSRKKNLDDWLEKKTGKKISIEKSKPQPPVSAEESKKIKHFVNKINNHGKESLETGLGNAEGIPLEKQVKDSLRDTSSIVSETMARVFIHQRHYDKAIRTYEQLSLKNPEKKRYFAEKIEELKKKQ